MVPLVSLSEELQQQAELIHEVARQVMGEHGMTIEYHVGTMIELPRAALTGRQDRRTRATSSRSARTI